MDTSSSIFQDISLALNTMDRSSSVSLLANLPSPTTSSRTASLISNQTSTPALPNTSKHSPSKPRLDTQNGAELTESERYSDGGLSKRDGIVPLFPVDTSALPPAKPTTIEDFVGNEGPTLEEISIWLAGQCGFAPMHPLARTARVANQQPVSLWRSFMPFTATQYSVAALVVLPPLVALSLHWLRDYQ